MLEQAGLVRRGFDQGRAMRVELLEAGPGAGAVVDNLLARYAREATARVERIVNFAESRRCRHLQVAEHFGESLDAALRRLRRLRPAATAPRPWQRQRESAPRRRGRVDRRHGRAPQLAARTSVPRGDAARIGLGAAVSACLPLVRPARGRHGRRGAALGQGARICRSAGRDRDRRLQGAPRGPGSLPAVARAGQDRGAGRRRPARPAALLAPRALAGGRCAGLRRAPRLDAPRPRVGSAAQPARARGGEGLRADQDRALR